MSYARWSSDKWACDLYVYESDNGFNINVAAVRMACVGEISPRYIAGGPLFGYGFGDPYAGVFGPVAIPDFMREPIGLPYDGASFVEDGPLAAWDRVAMLYECGYRGTRSLLPNLYIAALYDFYAGASLQ